jgi:hypothetical protein
MIMLETQMYGGQPLQSMMRLVYLLNEQIKKRDLEIVPNLGTKVLIFPKDVAADDSVRQFMNMVGTEDVELRYSILWLLTNV